MPTGTDIMKNRHPDPRGKQEKREPESGTPLQPTDYGQMMPNAVPGVGAAPPASDYGQLQPGAPMGSAMPQPSVARISVSPQTAGMESPLFVPDYAQNESRNLGAMSKSNSMSPNASQTTRVARGGGGAGMGGARHAGGMGVDDPTAARPRVKSVGAAAPIPRAVHAPGTGQALANGAMTPEQAAAQSNMITGVAQPQMADPQADQAFQQAMAQFEQLPPNLQQWVVQQVQQLEQQGVPQQMGLPQAIMALQQQAQAPQQAQQPPQQVPQQPMPQQPQQVVFPPQQAQQPQQAPAQPFSVGQPAAPPAFQAQPTPGMQPAQAPQQARPSGPPLPGRPGSLYEPGVHTGQPAATGGEFPRRPTSGVGNEMRPPVGRGNRVTQGGQAPTTRQSDPATRRGLIVREVESRLTREQADELRGTTAPAPAPTPAALEPADVEAWITVFRRPALTAHQLRALDEQSKPPQATWAYVDHGGIPLDEQALAAVPQSRNNINRGPWPRFMLAMQATTKFVAILDDDVVPGSQWIEQCTKLCEQHDVIISVSGVIYTEDRWDAVYEIGPLNPNEQTARVDAGRQGWFMRTDTLWKLMQSRPLSQNSNTGWDIHIAAMAKAHDIPMIVLPYTAETAGSVVMPADDEHSLSNALNSATLRDTVYRAYRAEGWTPGVVEDAQQGAEEAQADG